MIPKNPYPDDKLSRQNINQSAMPGERDRQKLCAISGIQLGRKFVIAGFMTSIIGIVIYCLFGCTSGNGLGLSLAGQIGLVLIAMGAVCWLVGAIKYFQGAVAADLPDELFF